MLALLFCQRIQKFSTVIQILYIISNYVWIYFLLRKTNTNYSLFRKKTAQLWMTDTIYLNFVFPLLNGQQNLVYDTQGCRSPTIFSSKSVKSQLLEGKYPKIDINFCWYVTLTLNHILQHIHFLCMFCNLELPFRRWLCS